MDPGGKEFNFGRSCDLHIPISYRMCVLSFSLSFFSTSRFPQAHLPSLSLVLLRFDSELVWKARSPGEVTKNFKSIRSGSLRDLSCRESTSLSCSDGGKAEASKLTHLLPSPFVSFRFHPSSVLSDLYITTQLFSDNKTLSLVYRTKHQSFSKSYTSVFNPALPSPPPSSVFRSSSPPFPPFVFRFWSSAGTNGSPPRICSPRFRPMLNSCSPCGIFRES